MPLNALMSVPVPRTGPDLVCTMDSCATAALEKTMTIATVRRVDEECMNLFSIALPQVAFA